MSQDTDSSLPQAAHGDAFALAAQAGEVVRLRPIVVLVVSADRCFRAAATMLLSRRGCTVLAAQDAPGALVQAADRPCDVLVAELARPAGHLRGARALAAAIDATAAAAGRRLAPVGLVVVGEPEELGDSIDADAGAALPVLDKWGPFERLYQAICERDRARRLPSPAAAPGWPAVARGV